MTIISIILIDRIPIPIHIVPMLQDFVLRPFDDGVCPVLEQQFNDLYAGPLFTQKTQQYQGNSKLSVKKKKDERIITINSIQFNSMQSI